MGYLGEESKGFSMRIQMAKEVIKKDSFRNYYINGKKNGFEFEVQVPYYRGLFISGMEEFEVAVDGEPMPQINTTFEINGREMPIFLLKYAATELWRQNENAIVRVIKKGGIPAGKHELDMKLYMRIPYMQIGEGHTYMSLDGCDHVEVELAD